MHTEFTIPVQTHGHYLLDDSLADSSLLIIGFHGYAESAAIQMQRLQVARIPGARLCSIQGLHCFYRGKQIAASWMTSHQREQCIDDNVHYIDEVIDAISKNHQHTQLVFVGFSQGAAMAYRAACHGRHPCHGIFINGGDIPPDVAPLLSRLPRLCIVRGEDDTAYDAMQLDSDVQRLGQQPHQVHTLAGGHTWTGECNKVLNIFIGNLEQR
jgi:predicted esterase